MKRFSLIRRTSYAVIFISMVFILGFPTRLKAEEMSTIPTEKLERILYYNSLKKDPFASAMFSFAYAGVGQFYTGDYTKGSLMFLGETLYHAFNLGIRFKFQETYGNSIGFTSMEAPDQWLLIGTFVAYLGLKIFSVYDAYNNAKLHNADIDKNIDQFLIAGNSDSVYFTYNLRF